LGHLGRRLTWCPAIQELLAPERPPEGVFEGSIGLLVNGRNAFALPDPGDVNRTIEQTACKGSSQQQPD